MAKGNKKLQGRIKRKRRIRAKISGTSQKPRLSVYRSCKHIYAQIIDDERGQTLFTVSDLSPQLVEEVAAKKEKRKSACTRKSRCFALSRKRDHYGGLRPKWISLSWTYSRTCEWRP
jgi:ribosomal protein L18